MVLMLIINIFLDGSHIKFFFVLAKVFHSNVSAQKKCSLWKAAALWYLRCATKTLLCLPCYIFFILLVSLSWAVFWMLATITIHPRGEARESITTQFPIPSLFPTYHFRPHPPTYRQKKIFHTMWCFTTKYIMMHAWRSSCIPLCSS